MSYRGDIRLGDTFDFHFTTRQISGAPATLASSPVLSAYPSNSVTQLTAGITLDVDFDSVTGLNHVRIVATGGNGYATATDYSVVITTGTVNSVSVVGEVVGTFSIEHRSALMPTTAARTLDVTATGGAGIDWANVENPTTTLGLTGTTIASTQKVDVDTIKTNPVVNGGTITFPTTATLASTTNITAGTIATVTNQLTAAAIATGIWQDATAGDFTASLSIGKSIMNGVTLGTGLTVNDITTKTGFALTSSYDFAKGTTAMTESYSVKGAAATPEQCLYEIKSILMERSRSSVTMTFGKVDGTPAMTATLDSATAPTSQTRAS